MMRLEVHGTKGTIRLIDDKIVELLDESGKAAETTAIQALVANHLGFEDVEGELYNMYHVLREGEPLMVTPGEAFHHLAFIVAALEAAETQKVAKVPQV